MYVLRKMCFIVFFFVKGGGQIFGFLVGKQKRGNNFQRGGPIKEKTMVISGYGLTFGSL